ncbi:MAG TPA: hypothetical protein P5277_05010 [Candidatus Paceibacterota bacterium]|nr:hypothetical protein [Candidatus Paceibacterota bacterium]
MNNQTTYNYANLVKDNPKILSKFSDFLEQRSLLEVRIENVEKHMEELYSSFQESQDYELVGKRFIEIYSEYMASKAKALLKQ